MKKDEMGKIYSTNGERRNLYRILVWLACTGFIFLSLLTGVEPFEHSNEPSGSMKY
jgi:hypothetical protein